MFKPRPSALLLTALLCWNGLSMGFAQTGSKDSPFMPQSGAPGLASDVSAGSHELVGVIASSKQTLVGITDKSTRKSIWIPVGASAEGIEVISCDPKQDSAVVRIEGQLQTLSMHGSSFLGATRSVPVPVPGPLAVPQVRSTAQVEQEKEARMLVSDLLEIGIQQRKAYEAAQREAAGKKSGPLPSVQTPK